MLKRLSIATKINLFVALIMAAVIIAASVFLLSTQIQNLKQQTVQRNLWVSKVDANFHRALYQENIASLAHFLQTYLNMPDVDYLAVRAASGQLLSHLSTTDDNPFVKNTFEKPEISNERPRLVAVPSTHKGLVAPTMALTIPVFAYSQQLRQPSGLSNSAGAKSQQLVGFVQIGINMAAVNAELNRFVQHSLSLGSMIFFAIMTFTVISTTLMMAPLKTLAHYAREISAGTLDKPITIKGSGEVRHIAANLNQIVEELNQHKSQVEKDNKVLSIKVADRTQRLKEQDVFLGAAVEQVTSAEERLRQMAYYDSLTLLPNRQLFIEQLEYLMEAAKRENNRVALLFMDLDNFKRINDSLGHSIGDLLLVAVAERLTDCLGSVKNLVDFSKDTIDYEIGVEVKALSLGFSRLGGDEFTVLMEDLSHSEDVAVVARKILEAMKDIFEIEGHELAVTPSIGIAMAPHDADTVEDLLKRADTAMYQAKKAGRNNFMFYDPTMKESSLERLKVEADLRKAIQNQEMTIRYQAQVNIDTGSIAGVECLVRWRHPEKGMISPAEFIPLAEEMGLINELGGWILNEACRQIRELKDFDLSLPKVSVNVSSLQFNSDFYHVVKKAIDDSGIDPQMLSLELTETVLMDNAESAIQGLKALKSLGVSLSVDDFGTGYSSLNYLSQFPLDELKIDRSFILGLNEEKGENLVAAIIAMAKSLDLRLVAEGVDSNEQFVFLREKGVDVIQGYLFCKQLTVEELILILENNPYPKQLLQIDRQLQQKM